MDIGLGRVRFLESDGVIPGGHDFVNVRLEGALDVVGGSGELGAVVVFSDLYNVFDALGQAAEWAWVGLTALVL